MASFSQSGSDVDQAPEADEARAVLQAGAAEPACRLASIALAVSGEVRCPVCHQLMPPEHIGYKLHCRRCGYLESCCNPI